MAEQPADYRTEPTRWRIEAIIVREWLAQLTYRDLRVLVVLVAFIEHDNVAHLSIGGVAFLANLSIIDTERALDRLDRLWLYKEARTASKTRMMELLDPNLARPDLRTTEIVRHRRRDDAVQFAEGVMQWRLRTVCENEWWRKLRRGDAKVLLVLLAMTGNYDGVQVKLSNVAKWSGQSWDGAYQSVMKMQDLGLLEAHIEAGYKHEFWMEDGGLAPHDREAEIVARAQRGF